MQLNGGEKAGRVERISQAGEDLVAWALHQVARFGVVVAVVVAAQRLELFRRVVLHNTGMSLRQQKQPQS